MNKDKQRIIELLRLNHCIDLKMILIVIDEIKVYAMKNHLDSSCFKIIVKPESFSNLFIELRSLMKKHGNENKPSSKNALSWTIKGIEVLPWGFNYDHQNNCEFVIDYFHQTRQFQKMIEEIEAVRPILGKYNCKGYKMYAV